MAQSQEIPLKDVLLQFRAYVLMGLGRWYLILPAGLALAAYLAYEAKQEPRRYTAPLTFVVNEDEGGGVSMGGLLGQFGLPANSPGINVDKMFALARSGKIVNALLLDSVVIDGRADRFANHLLRTEQLTETWALTDPAAITGNSLEAMTLQERSLFRRLHLYLLREETPIIRFSTDKDTKIHRIAAAARNEQLSLELALHLYDLLSSFYTEETTGNARASVERLRGKKDSLAAALSTAEYGLATSQDTRLGLIQRRDVVRQRQLERQVQILNLSYAEVLRNLETADFALSTKTPFFQTVDLPYTPLYAHSANWRTAAIKGFVLGALAVFSLLAAWKFYREIMK
ncbi:MAG: hypothetical protein AAFN92_16070 [Bacteroidota bacterium]